MDKKQGTKKKIIILLWPKYIKSYNIIFACSFPPTPQGVQIWTNAKSVLNGIVDIEYYKIATIEQWVCN